MTWDIQAMNGFGLYLLMIVSSDSIMEYITDVVKEGSFTI